MDETIYLAHHGIKGMRWGIRRFQNKDGSLTPLGKKRAKGEGEESKEETVEEKRTRVLKSTNAKEIYENKDILTTAEINERLNRIDTEARLARVAEGTKKSGMDKVDSVLKYARKANEIYELTNTSLGKAIKKQLGDKVDKNLSPDLKKVWENRDKMTDEQLTKVLKRATTEKTIKKMIDEYDEAKKKASSDSDSTKSESTGTDKKDATDSSNKTEDTKTYSGTVEGKGNSKFTGWDDGPTVDAKEGKDYWTVNDDIRNTKMSETTALVPSGKNYITELLKDKSGGS